MNTTERVAYIKGLAEGLDLDETTKEGKLLKAIIEVLGDMAEDAADLEDYVAELSEQVDAVDEDLSTLEEVVYEEFDDEDDCDCDCDCDCCGDWDEDLYDVTCPTCGEEIVIDEETLLDGGIDCPNCGEPLEFELDEDEAEEE